MAQYQKTRIVSSFDLTDNKIGLQIGQWVSIDGMTRAQYMGNSQNIVFSSFPINGKFSKESAMKNGHVRAIAKLHGSK